METTLFLARLYGMVFVALGLSMMLNKAYYKKVFKEMMGNDIYLFLGGILALLAGTSIISFHNVWDTPLAAVISLFGWFGVLKGLSLLLMPKQFADQFKGMYKSDEHIFGFGILLFLIGLILFFVGFFV